MWKEIILDFLIHETFQRTIQGEGYHSGRLCDFIRLYGCPVGCSWCDTGYADGGSTISPTRMGIDHLISETSSPMVVISGGEPFSCSSLPVLVNALIQAGRFVAIETSGIRWLDISPSAWVTLSPKQHVSPNFAVHEKIVQRCNEIKIIVSDGSEVDFYSQLIASLPLSVHQYLQPEWTAIRSSLPIALELLQSHPKFKLSSQLHKLLGVQ